ncbi:inositol monophosphatase family protein [Paracoccus fistulariae]|uniref:3'(2'),5'-bisphosphate nucleotidase CysQ n=1 Tax=Paracoccus fistulariae TaxID=658446 RepID=A0ABY7SH86_9RHOB|nr:3'(2'),5'-bisphosphate nucleotidase CysQ [Paracoccus fistulariae]MDB6180953.1 3'(2'),5'-bisphosphate nucleotidase CysQ [Paracoccus fistulariae]WCR06249.1 3'(2'),5'-bisphosphate nucleotidase CysQ [Paracoccus fistulariae]
MPGPEDDLALLTEAAREAGQIALRYWKQDPETWEKADDAGPVTEADLAVNDALARKLQAARPDYGWLSEESEADPSRLDADHCFIIDPIDGTRAFIAGQEGFSHSLAIAQGDDIIAAVVYLPARDILYTASKDGPALRNGDPIAPCDADIDGASVLTYRAASEPGYWRGGTTPPFRREFRPSLAWRLCLAAEGRFDAALSLRAAWEWDIAAGSLIAERAGALATDRRGGRMRFNSPKAMVDGLIVAGPRLHRQILDALAPAGQG